jgi:hypothetical protein
MKDGVNGEDYLVKGTIERERHLCKITRWKIEREDMTFCDSLERPYGKHYGTTFIN